MTDKQNLIPSAISSIEWFYTHFIGRDFAYLYAGGLFFCILEYALFNTIYLPQNLSLELVGFLSSSYFMGLILRDIPSRILPYLKLKQPDQNEILFLRDLVENYDGRIINLYERHIYVYISGISVGSSSFFGGILMTVIAVYRSFFNSINPSNNYILLAFSLILLGVIMFHKAISYARNIEEQQLLLLDDIKKNDRKHLNFRDK